MTERKAKKERRNLLDKLIDWMGSKGMELHIPLYQYCGPGTQLEERLAKGVQGINQLDEACKLHDIRYGKSKSSKRRSVADKELEKAAGRRVFAPDASLSERVFGACIAITMRIKRKLSFNCGGLNCFKSHSPKDTNEDDLEVLNKPKNDWPSAVPILQQGIELRGIVTHITDEGILHFLERNDSKIVDNMSKRIKAIVESKKNEEFDWQIGDICFAKHPTHDKFCRGKVIHIGPNKSSYKIHYVDHGNENYVDASNLHIATEFVNDPRLSQKLAISRLVSRGKFMGSVLNELETQLIDHLVTIRVDNLDDIPKCTVIPAKLPCDIFDWLVLKELGRASQPSSTNEQILYVDLDPL